MAVFPLERSREEAIDHNLGCTNTVSVFTNKAELIARSAT